MPSLRARLPIFQGSLPGKVPRTPGYFFMTTSRRKTTFLQYSDRDIFHTEHTPAFRVYFRACSVRNRT